MEASGIPGPVREAYALDDAAETSVDAGWINDTFIARRRAEPCVVQRLHPAFRAPVNLDIEAITEHIAAKGMLTPRLVRTEDGEAWKTDRCEGREDVWRCLTYIEGRTVASLTPALARSAGGIAARFHGAVQDLDHRFHFTRPGAHDTAAHLAKLARLRAEHGDGVEWSRLADRVLRAGEELPAPPPLPPRIVHGDLKATNLRFASEGDEAVAILDLDTLAHGTLMEELGDALRSWCNPTHEADPDAAVCVDRFAAAVRGYAEAAGGAIDAEEREAIVPGLERICVELASRFAADLYEDSYFGWDAARHPSRRAHNTARVRAQLSLALSVREARGRLEHLVASAFE